jgi:hypothetical protein
MGRRIIRSVLILVSAELGMGEDQESFLSLYLERFSLTFLCNSGQRWRIQDSQRRQPDDFLQED